MPTNLNKLSVTDLLKLRKDIDLQLLTHRSELERMLGEIGGGRSASAPKSRQSRLAGKKVKAKYRHPKTGEEWSGRGGVAKWLAAEIKAGKKKEAFLIK